MCGQLQSIFLFFSSSCLLLITPLFFVTPSCPPDLSMMCSACFGVDPGQEEASALQGEGEVIAMGHLQAGLE